MTGHSHCASLDSPINPIHGKFLAQAEAALHWRSSEVAQASCLFSLRVRSFCPGGLTQFGQRPGIHEGFSDFDDVPIDGPRNVI